MITIDILGPQMTSEEKTILDHPNVSSVILFERNVIQYHRDSLQQLTEQIHHLRPDVFIMTDHEGGNVQRFRRMGFRPLMSAGSIGRIYSLHEETGLHIAYQEGLQMAEDLIACGIDLSLAPVLDLLHAQSSIIAGLDRAFHHDPNQISLIAQNYIKGMHQAQMPSVGKHFPGHGSADSDSHRTLPILNKTYQQLEESDLMPFIKLMQNKCLDAVMPAHIIYPTIDPKFATTYSSHWLQHILRQKLQFDGLVISDCLGMKGADIGDLTTRAFQALEAGCELLIVANQSREVLLDLLNQLPQQKQPRLEQFKLKMARFNNPSQIKPPLLSNTSIEHFDPKNPTESV